MEKAGIREFTIGDTYGINCRFSIFLLIRVHLRLSAVNEVEKTKPIYSYCVLRTGLEKTSLS
jgi:hypothetical protein